MLYFLAGYSIIDPLYPDASGLFTAALGIFYCMLAMMVGGGKPAGGAAFRHFLLTSGFVLLAIAVPVQFDGKWVVVGWAAEALAFIATGFKMRFGAYRFSGNGLFAITLFRILFFESDLLPFAKPFVNDRFFAYFAFFVAAAAAAYLYRRHKQEVSADEKSLFSLLALAAAFVGLAGFTLEIHDFFEGYWYSILWTAGGLAAGALSLQTEKHRLKIGYLCCFLLCVFPPAVFRNRHKPDRICAVVQYPGSGVCDAFGNDRQDISLNAARQ